MIYYMFGALLGGVIGFVLGAWGHKQILKNAAERRIIEVDGHIYAMSEITMEEVEMTDAE